ncbi:MAG TPA: PQQ-dependent dehydrogenase, methanol/ethanol family [Bryobacteraceae bacterium]|nr:PQQ-dependent dehydrogenase, methanol/ethanol family [Bryobacteraceae bacterium]
MKPCRLLLAFSLTLLSLDGQDGATRADWPSYGGTHLAWRYSALDQINTANVKKLAPAWAFQTGDYDQGLQSTPIVIDGVLYLSTTHSQVFALDAATGRMIWEYKYPMPRGAGGNIQNRGLAVGAGKVFVGTYDDYVVAIDQKTGAEAWKVAMNDARQCGCSITGAPLLVKDKVIVGTAGGDGAFRGYLTALDATTGRLAWRFYTIPGKGEKGNETWKGDSWKYGGGATWMTGSFDADLNLVYWGVGNAASDMYAANRYSGEGEGANLYTGSVIALDADTGKLKWYYQEIPKDVWDYDAAYECVLIDRAVRGVMRKLLVHINKSGYAWVLDRTNGKFLGAFPIVDYHTWLTGMTEDGKIFGRVEPVEGKTTLICPGPDGGKSWNQVAYSPHTGLMYTPTLEICSDSTAREQEPVEGRGFLGGTWSHRAPPDGPAYSHIDAYDPVTGKRVWSVRYKYALLASMLATAGDLVFTGDPEGYFFALDARTGNKLWSFQTGGGNRGSAVSYNVKGRQYIATPTGWGSIAGRSMISIWPEAETFRPGSTLMVFALPEGAQ